MTTDLVLRSGETIQLPMSPAPEQLAAVRDMLARAGSRAFIEVDGGVDAGNIRAVVEAGASVVVAGNAVFGQPDAAAAVRALRAAANGQGA